MLKMSGLIANFLEDIPQFAIQIYYAVIAVGFDPIMTVSIITSLTSLSFGLFKRIVIYFLHKNEPNKEVPENEFELTF